MKIMYVNDALIIWGGLERILVDKMNSLAEVPDYKVFMVTSDQGTHPVPFSLSPRVNLFDLGILFQQQYRYNGLKRLAYKWRLKRLYCKCLKKAIEDISPDVIICPRIHLLFTVLRASGSIPVIYESHSLCKSYLYDGSRIIQKLRTLCERESVRKVQELVALTEGDASDWKQFNRNVCTIPNMVHLNDTGNYSDCTSKRAIFVGRLSMQKDVGSLYKIWSLVYQKHPDWQLHIFGGYGELYDEDMALLKDNSSNIYVHEPTQEIFKEYVDSSMLLLTSCYEPFGLVLPEAMSCGVPVVAFDCPYGPADIITDGKDGFLIKDRSISHFVEKVNLLIEDDRLRKEMGKAGRWTSKRYTVEQIMPKWVDLLNKYKK